MVALKTKVLALTEDGLRCLPVYKTVVYTIRDKKGRNLFTAVASRGRVLAKIKEHLIGGSSHLIGGIAVQIQQQRTIASAIETASQIVARDKPRYKEWEQP
jgi:hypothetical protein